MSSNDSTEETTPLVQNNEKDGVQPSDRWGRWKLISLSEALQVPHCLRVSTLQIEILQKK